MSDTGQRPRSAPIVADVVIIGDGPAGSALARAINDVADRPDGVAIDVVLVGPDAPWTATYSAWADQIENNPLTSGHQVWKHRFDDIDVRSRGTRTLPRAYGVLDNDAFRTVLRTGVRHERRRIDALDQVEGHLVFDATGWPSKVTDTVHDEHADIDWQVAYGVVLAAPPDGPLGRPMLMDFSDPYDGTGAADGLGVTTFGYSLPVDGGWLVEETVLAGPDIAPAALMPRLAARLAVTVDELADMAISVEEVRIPMGAPMSDAASPIAFGAAAGLIHPATGYSIAASLSAAQRVATAVRAGFDRSSGADVNVDVASIHAAIWPMSARRTRRLHEYGLDVLTRLDDEATRDFFDTFFGLGVTDQAAYLDIDTRPTTLAAVMMRMFVRSSWSMRRRLAGGDLRRLGRVLRPTSWPNPGVAGPPTVAPPAPIRPLRRARR